ncbi:hypothetical protein [Alteromonas oceanisediminis]|uniref:hypothetical protein n=1 Tax=Alteromonas oceanisediminis TaxID=2836180 RepID=UPI001BDA1021|nr:hypothetical protein [Alteromonas oceanisediminis]MBT0585921.1 hypothetical protein [Alteromonas oceanisediminis]
MTERTLHTSTLLRSGLVFVCTLLLAQFSFSVAHLLSYQHSIEHALHQIDVRVSLDVASLDLGDPMTKQTLNPQRVERYIDTLNSHIASHMRVPEVQVTSIRYVYAPDDADFASQHSLFVIPQRSLLATDSNLAIQIDIEPLPWHQSLTFHWLGLLMAIVISVLYARRFEHKVERKAHIQQSEQRVKLRIDLPKKQVVNVGTGAAVDMQNKPLCFFTALVEYCIANPNGELLHHKDVPPELVARANKVFARLIVLGHTKRKRPDFNANLEKTLSEIRALLDLVFNQNEPCKSLFYPPRAQGEGSRSKQHSYALTEITAEHVEIIGL